MNNDQQPELTTESLAGLNIFSGLEPAQLARLQPHCRLARYHAGEVLLTEGDRGESLAVVLDGSVRVFLPAEGQDKARFTDLDLATLGPGELFGEYSFIDLRPASASVAAVSDCTIMHIGYDDLRTVLRGHCELACRFYENLLLVLTDRLRADDRELDLFSGAGD